MEQSFKEQGGLKMKYIIFRVQGENYGIDISRIQAIEHNMNIRSIPNAPKFIKGLIQLRGEIIPVYNINYKFGYLSKASEASKLLIARVQNSVVGIEVDEVKEIQEFDEKDIHGVPSILNASNTSYINEIAKLDKELVIIINLEQLFTDKELDELEKVSKAE